MRVSKQWTDEGRTARKSVSGPRNVTSAREDRRLVRMAQTDHTAFSRQLAAQWSTATRVSLCASSIRRRLLQRGLRARIPLYRIPLTQNHRRICTRWVEAVPVRNIKEKTTCEALMKIFTQTGFPKIICTDQGSNFTAELTEAFKDAVGIAPRFATPGHPESMGALSCQIAQQASRHTNLAILYGRLPNGPLKLLKEFWTGDKEIPTGSSKSIEEYLRDLTEKLKQAHNLARGNSEKAQAEYANRYNLRSREKRLAVGDKVLELIPSSSHKLLKKWMGPASIVELPRPHTARVKMEDGSERELHFNKLRPYVARIEQIGLIFDQDNEFGDLHYAPTDTVELDVNDIYKYVMDGSAGLENPQKHQLADLLSKLSDVISSVPGSAKVKGHSVSLMPDFVPKKLKPYCIPITLQEEVNKQINDLLQLGLIEPSESEWAHPIVCVSKKDGSVRLCIDYRLLNNVTITDAYPMQNARNLLFEIGQARFISVLDLT
ncbi:hypothetical protein TNCV_3211211 [Trichonephila clavipes]|uniref:Integrase catalytic domain-containing protein n=1 Tax=Trichonephila clavipes TaxID=2585209 RepID=A0A8X6V8Q3_TRICX|nr:hypothetical protein TNCV_3211211 [Trichonephila clavipes]